MSANSLKQDGAELSGLTLSGLSEIKRPYGCGLCGQLFAQPAMLEKHRCKRTRKSAVLGELLPGPVIETSAGVKVSKEEAGNSGYMCGECGQNFLYESAVYSHMLTMHMSKFCFRTRLYQPLYILVVVVIVVGRHWHSSLLLVSLLIFCSCLVWHQKDVVKYRFSKLN